MKKLTEYKKNMSVCKLSDADLLQEIIDGKRNKPLKGLNEVEQKEVEAVMSEFGCEKLVIPATRGRKAYHLAHMGLLKIVTAGYDYRKLKIWFNHNQEAFDGLREQLKIETVKKRKGKHFNRALSVQK